jgi:hypothetical protein
LKTFLFAVIAAVAAPAADRIGTLILLPLVAENSVVLLGIIVNPRDQSPSMRRQPVRSVSRRFCQGPGAGECQVSLFVIGFPSGQLYSIFIPRGWLGRCQA